MAQWHSVHYSTQGTQQPQCKGCPIAAGGSWLLCSFPMKTSLEHSLTYLPSLNEQFPPHTPAPTRPAPCSRSRKSSTGLEAPGGKHYAYFSYQGSPQLAYGLPHRRHSICIWWMEGRAECGQNPTHPFCLDFETSYFLKKVKFNKF